MDVVIFARYWEPGKVKTRLCPPLRIEEAARVSGFFLDALVARLSRNPELSLVIAYEPDEARDAFARRYAVPLEAQRGNGLTEKLSHVISGRTSPCLITGSDCPTTPLEFFRQATRALLNSADVVLAPTEDGGTCILGARPGFEGWFSGIPWSSGRERRELQAKARGFGWRCDTLATWYDVDRPSDIPRATRDLRKCFLRGELDRFDFMDGLNDLDELSRRIES